MSILGYLPHYKHGAITLTDRSSSPLCLSEDLSAPGIPFGVATPVLQMLVALCICLTAVNDSCVMYWSNQNDG